jgi:hypothetical protein
MNNINITRYEITIKELLQVNKNIQELENKPRFVQKFVRDGRI